jgi:hypothetical protein
MLLAFGCTLFTRIGAGGAQVKFMFTVKAELLCSGRAQRRAFDVELYAARKMRNVRFGKTLRSAQAAGRHALKAGVNTILKIVWFHTACFEKPCLKIVPLQELLFLRAANAIAQCRA